MFDPHKSVFAALTAVVLLATVAVTTPSRRWPPTYTGDPILDRTAQPTHKKEQVTDRAKNQATFTTN